MGKLIVAIAFRQPFGLEQPVKTTKPSLTIVPKTRKYASRTIVVIFLITTFLCGVVALRTYMAQQQMRLDTITSDIESSRDYFDELRATKAELESPSVLLQKARNIGMVPVWGTKVLEIPALVAAEVAATVGKVDIDVAAGGGSALEEFGKVKAKTGTAP